MRRCRQQSAPIGSVLGGKGEVLLPVSPVFPSPRTLYRSFCSAVSSAKKASILVCVRLNSSASIPWLQPESCTPRGARTRAVRGGRGRGRAGEQRVSGWRMLGQCEDEPRSRGSDGGTNPVSMAKPISASAGPNVFPAFSISAALVGAFSSSAMSSVSN